MRHSSKCSVSTAPNGQWQQGTGESRDPLITRTDVGRCSPSGGAPRPGGQPPVDIEPDTDPVAAVLLHDAQTSGGLLIAVAPDAMDGLRDDLRAQGAEAAVVGTVQAGPAGPASPAGPAGRITVRATGDAGVVS